MNPSTDDAAALAGHRRRIEGLCRWLAGQAGGTPAPIERIETHLSTVLLCGALAYKLKKPLAPGFVDFRGLASREHFIREELRLNQRLAPRVYRGVRPVLGDDDHPRLGEPDARGDGAIDWALEMQRFDPAQGLDALARRGELTPGLIDELAGLLARFHVGLPAADARHGSPEAAWPWVAETLASLRQHAGPADRARVAALADWTHRRFARQRGLMQARHDGGWVREGHGDLHLANIALIDGHATPFDALEFSPDLRCIDIVDDLAFPFMDLLAHGLPALAWRLVNGWCEITGDHAGLALLRWYAVQRALVRAKVAWLSAAQSSDETTQAARSADARRYLATAEQLADPGQRQLVTVWGLSGSGKSTVAGDVAEALGAIRLRSDVERKRLHGLRADERPADPATLYGIEAGRRTYARLGALAAGLLAADLDAVVDAACLKRAERRALHRVADEAQAAWHLLACEAPADVLAGRITTRAAAGTDASDATLAVLAMQQQSIEPLADDERAGAESIDTSVSRAAMADACRRLAQTWRAAAAPRATTAAPADPTPRVHAPPAP